MKHAGLLLVTVVTSVVVSACGTAGDGASGAGSSGASPDPSGSPAGPGGGGGDAAAPDGGRDAGVPKPADVGFVIKVDYRFDTKGFFAAPERRAALEGAARIWGRLIKDDFPTVPKGTHVKVRDPEHPDEPALSLDIDEDIDDLVVFVGASTFPGSTTASSQATAGLAAITDETLRTALDQRFRAVPFQPWTGWISFGEDEPWYFDPDPETPKPVPAGKLDFVSVALHEMCHVLGFGTADAFHALATTGAFTGAKARAAWGGEPPALAADRKHFAASVLVSGERPLMDVSDAAGTRYLPLTVDRAVLEDLGFHF